MVGWSVGPRAAASMDIVNPPLDVDDSDCCCFNGCCCCFGVSWVLASETITEGLLCFDDDASSFFAASLSSLDVSLMTLEGTWALYAGVMFPGRVGSMSLRGLYTP